MRGPPPPLSTKAAAIEKRLRDELNRVNLRMSLSGGQEIPYTLQIRDMPQDLVCVEVTYGFMDLRFWPLTPEQAVSMLVDAVKVGTERKAHFAGKDGTKVGRVRLQQPKPKVAPVNIVEDVKDLPREKPPLDPPASPR